MLSEGGIFCNGMVLTQGARGSTMSDVTGCSEIGTCRVKAPVTVGVASPDVEVIKESYRGRVTLLAQHG